MRKKDKFYLNPEISVSFGNRMRQLRNELGLDPYQLHDRIYKDEDPDSYEKSTKRKKIAAWEQGKNMPSACMIPKIADALGCDIDYLFGRIKDKTHTIEFIHNELGMQPSFIEKLIEVRTSFLQATVPSFGDGMVPFYDNDSTDIALILLEYIYNNSELMDLLREYLEVNNSSQIELKTSALAKNGIPVSDLPSDSILLPMDGGSSLTINGYPLDASLIKQNLIHKIQNALDKMGVKLPSGDIDHYYSL